MLEFLVALLIFSTGMMGMMTAQLAGKKAGYEASRRSVATALARDILERMRANSGQLEAYRISGAGNESRRLPQPGVNCDTSVCTAAQLAAFDVWQWESLLLGESESYAGVSTGGLFSPRACIATAGGEVDVAISWLGVANIGVESEAVCGAGGAGLESEPEGMPDTSPRRHQLTISTFIAAH
jgi:type IV pilus assembly protein PilV